MDICAICHETLDVKYILPECNHAFHTECIMTWFRAGHDKCPLCNNVGSNHFTYSNKREAYMDTYRKIRRQANKKDTLPDVKRRIKNIKKIEEKLVNIKTGLITFNATIHNKSASEVIKDHNRIRKLRNRTQYNLDRKKMDLGSIYFATIIIPIKTTI